MGKGRKKEGNTGLNFARVQSEAFPLRACFDAMVLRASKNCEPSGHSEGRFHLDVKAPTNPVNPNLAN